MEILLNRPLAHLNDSVWASCAGRYYINGKSLLIPREMYHYKNADWVRDALESHATNNNYNMFNNSVARFVAANQIHLEEITQEAIAFTREAAKDYPPERRVVSFSGGKDSTVCADIVKRALMPLQPTFIFSDTTLEFPQTYEYVNRFQKENPNFYTARNDEQDFFEVCKDIGPPSRHMRWCCTMFKTGPIAKTLPRFFGDKDVISFIGIRAAESNGRKKYVRMAYATTERKVQQEVSTFPIFDWTESDVWLYILKNQLDFCEAYRLGHKRVGCWLCPNGTQQKFFLNYVYLSDMAPAWREQLFAFAEATGKIDIERYVDELYWAYRRGGAGLKASADVVVNTMGCTMEEQAKLYALNKPIDESFYSLFIPLGMIAHEKGRKLLNEVLVQDAQDVPLLSLQSFQQADYNHAIKVKILAEKGHSTLQRKVVYQVRKFNACRNCGKCHSVCTTGAIEIKDGKYRINADKCNRCGKCVNYKYMPGGCLMQRVLSTKKLVAT